MESSKKSNLLAVLPTDPTRVSVSSFLEISKALFHAGTKTISYKDLPQDLAFRITIRKHTLAYLAKLGILNQERRSGHYHINENNEVGLNYLRNLSHGRDQQAYGYLRTIFVESSLYNHLCSFFKEKRNKSINELIVYLKQAESKDLSISTVERKTKFLCHMLNIIDLADYQHGNRTVVWKDISSRNQEEFGSDQPISIENRTDSEQELLEDDFSLFKNLTFHRIKW